MDEDQIEDCPFGLAITFVCITLADISCRLMGGSSRIGRRENMMLLKG